MTTGTHELTRFRPLGRGTFIGGVFVTALIHVGLVALVWYGNIKAEVREERPRDILTTTTIQLGKPREKFWLPRIVTPPKAEAPEPTIKVAEDPDAKPTIKEPPRPDDPKISKALQRAMQRARTLADNSVEEPIEGSLTGSGTGTSNQIGDEYATQVKEAFRRNWNVPTGLSIGDVIELEVEIKIQIGDDGRVLFSAVRKSSGNSLYDDSALQAVQATRAVPPPPAAVRAMYRKGVALAFGGKELAR